MSKIILHLGYPKTGTSTLQSAVFDLLHQAGHIRYLGMEGFQNDASPERRNFFVALTDALYFEDEAQFSERLPALQSAYAGLKQNLPGDGPLVLSNEHFLFSSWSSRHANARIFPRRSAARLARVFEREEVALIVATRDLPELIRSVYVQIRSTKSHVNAARIDKTLDEYLARICAFRDFQSDMYKVDQSLAQYKTAFPEAPLFTLQFDDFINHQRASVSGILDFMGLPAMTLDAFTFPLEHSNAKVKTDKGTVVENMPPYLKPFARNNFLSPWLRRLSKAGPLKALRAMLLPREEIPNLTDEQRRKIESAFFSDMSTHVINNKDGA